MSLVPIDGAPGYYPEHSCSALMKSANCGAHRRSSEEIHFIIKENKNNARGIEDTRIYCHVYNGRIFLGGVQGRDFE